MKHLLPILIVVVLVSYGGTALSQIDQSIALARQGKYEEALQTIDDAEKKGTPKNVIQYYYGCISFIKGEYPKARNYYTEAIKIAPNDWYPYFDRARAYMEEGNFMKALQDINSALDFAGDYYFDVLNNRGIIYGKSKRYKKAMDDFNACIAMKPNSPDPYINIGNMLMQQKKYAEAEEQYSHAIALDDKNVVAYNNRANAREMQADLDGAQEDIDMYNQLIMK
ncbi:MAG: tetratricopeptide repeat protein [Bacteroidales bacterium]|nr:tetratricopeptide repeat protein [Bacteroidales bacterium]